MTEDDLMLYGDQRSTNMNFGSESIDKTLAIKNSKDPRGRGRGVKPNSKPKAN